MDFDFSTNQELDDDGLAKVPEGYRGAYEKGDDGKHRISAGFKPYVDAIVGLGGALKNERNTSKTLKGQKDASAQVKEAFGFDTIDEAKAKWDEMAQTIAANGKVDPAKIKADIEKTFNVQLQGEKDKNVAMQSTLRRYMIEAAAATALGAAKGNSKLLMPLIREAVELVEDDGEYVVRVKDGQGDYRGNGKGGFMSVEDLVAEMRASKDYGAAFESDSGGGTDTRTGQRPGQGQQRQMQRQQDREGMSSTDRIQAGLQARRRGR